MGKSAGSKSHKYCCVPQCKFRYTNEISLFFFPKDEALRKRWADAIKIEKPLTQRMQVCSRHFTKNDYVLSEYPGTTKVRRLKKTAVPSQNLPWHFPNNRVSPSLAKARMERLKNRTQQKTSNTPETKSDAKKQKDSVNINVSPKSSAKIYESDTNKSTDDEDPFDKLLEQDKKETTDKKQSETTTKKEKDTQQVDKSSEAEKKSINVRDGAPTRLRQRQSVLKCELCGRKCLTPQALRTHQQIAHKNIKNDLSDPEKSPPAMSMAKDPGKPTPVALIAVKQPGKAIESKAIGKVNNNEKPSKISSLVEEVLRDNDSDMTDYETDDSSETNQKKNELKQEKRDKTKVEFECPKCSKRFAVLFSAKKHVQKYHLGLGMSDDVQIELPQELKPIPMEICTICNTQLHSSIHYCAGPLKLAQGFICTGCKQEFKSMSLFDLHKSGMHNDGVESMFFPTLDEFENWKSKMQNQTKVSYSVLDQNDTKKIHRCSHVENRGYGSRSRSHMCPSSIIVQEYTKGFQVHYYPNHHGHESIKYNLSQAFSKYSIASLMNMTASQLPDSDDEDLKETDLYLQFRRLTELLVNDAARINVKTLKMLMRKALEMISIMNNYNEDEDTMTFSDADDDLKEEVRNALRSLKKDQHKRPSMTAPETSLIKRSKSVFQSKENIKAKPVKSNSAVIKIKEEDTENVSEKKPVFEKTTRSPPSFIDSFQQFVGKTKETNAVKKKPPNAQRNVKKDIVKTKIGQFKPGPKKNLSPSLNQFSPSRTSIGSIKDIEYEVKEQENDCNILILKI